MRTFSNPYDFFPTPPECYEVLPRFINFGNITSFLEPCAGDGRILNWVAELTKNNSPHCYCMGVDIQGDYGKVDYLTYKSDYRFDLIVTNPPYSNALQFAAKMIRDARIVVSLMRLDFLGSQGRKDFFNQNPLYSLYVLTKRPSFTKNGKTDQYNYGWFVWCKPEGCKIDWPLQGIHHI